MNTSSTLDPEVAELSAFLRAHLPGGLSDERRGELARRWPSAVAGVAAFEADEAGPRLATRIEVGRNEAGELYVQPQTVAYR